MKTKVWMKVSNDEYELPIAVAETAAELAKLCGVTVNSIYSQISRVKSGVCASSSYVCVTV